MFTLRAPEGLEASKRRQGLIEFGLSFPLAGMAVVLMVKVEPSTWPGTGGSQGSSGKPLSGICESAEAQLAQVAAPRAAGFPELP